MHCPKCHTHIPWGEFRCENPDCGKEDAVARVCRTCGGKGCKWGWKKGGHSTVRKCKACNGTGEEESDGDD